MDSYLPKHILLEVINSSVALGKHVLLSSLLRNTAPGNDSRSVCLQSISPQTLYVGSFPTAPPFDIFHSPGFKTCPRNSPWPRCRLPHSQPRPHLSRFGKPPSVECSKHSPPMQINISPQLCSHYWFIFLPKTSRINFIMSLLSFYCITIKSLGIPGSLHTHVILSLELFTSLKLT